VHAGGNGRASSDSDWERIEKAKRAKNGAAFSRLWEGHYWAYSSHSEADQALCGHLAWWLDRDPARIDAAFRQSGLMRPKWDERHGEETYGQRTIRKALQLVSASYRAQERKAGSKARPHGAYRRKSRTQASTGRLATTSSWLTSSRNMSPCSGVGTPCTRTGWVAR
jgi:primase-polymerase (primpol)-like protein